MIRAICQNPCKHGGAWQRASPPAVALKCRPVMAIFKAMPRWVLVSAAAGARGVLEPFSASPACRFPSLAVRAGVYAEAVASAAPPVRALLGRAEGA